MSTRAAGKGVGMVLHVLKIPHLAVEPHIAEQVVPQHPSLTCVLLGAGISSEESHVRGHLVSKNRTDAFPRWKAVHSSTRQQPKLSLTNDVHCLGNLLQSLGHGPSIICLLSGFGTLVKEILCNDLEL